MTENELITTEEGIIQEVNSFREYIDEKIEEIICEENPEIMHRLANSLAMLVDPEGKNDIELYYDVIMENIKGSGKIDLNIN